MSVKITTVPVVGNIPVWRVVVVLEGVVVLGGGWRRGASQSAVSSENPGSHHTAYPTTTPAMRRIILSQCILLSAGLALATDSKTDLVSCPVRECWRRKSVVRAER